MKVPIPNTWCTKTRPMTHSSNKNLSNSPKMLIGIMLNKKFSIVRNQPWNGFWPWKIKIIQINTILKIKEIPIKTEIIQQIYKMPIEWATSMLLREWWPKKETVVRVEVGNNQRALIMGLHFVRSQKVD